jgi:hypothetical protein
LALIRSKARAGIGALTFRSGGTIISARGVTAWEWIMKSMALGAFAFASALALASIPAHALTFDFSFTNVSGNTSGTVTGEIDGLVDNANSKATHVIIDSVPSVTHIPTPFPIIPFFALDNSFTVTRVASESLSLGDCRESCVFIGLLVLVGVRYW